MLAINKQWRDWVFGWLFWWLPDCKEICIVKGACVTKRYLALAILQLNFYSNIKIFQDFCWLRPKRAMTQSKARWACWMNFLHQKVQITFFVILKLTNIFVTLRKGLIAKTIMPIIGCVWGTRWKAGAARRSRSTAWNRQHQSNQ